MEFLSIVYDNRARLSLEAVTNDTKIVKLSSSDLKPLARNSCVTLTKSQCRRVNSIKDHRITNRVIKI